MKKFLFTVLTVLFSLSAFAQDELVQWSHKVEKVSKDEVKVVFTGRIARGYHTYTLFDETSATEIMDAEVKGGELKDDVYAISKAVKVGNDYFYEGVISIAQNIKLTARKGTYSGTIYCNVCNEGTCKSEYYDFEIPLSR